MTTEEALVKLAESTGAAIEQVLEIVSSATIERSPVMIVPSGQSPLSSIPVPAVAADVSYIHGVTGGNVFVMTRLGVRRLAAAMMGMDAMEIADSEELSELDLSAAAEAMNQMMAAAAGATSTVLGEEVDITPPETRFFATPTQAADAYVSCPVIYSASWSPNTCERMPSRSPLAPMMLSSDAWPSAGCLSRRPRSDLRTLSLPSTSCAAPAHTHASLAGKPMADF